VIAALAVMCDLSIPFVEKTITRQQTEILLVIARAIGLSWPTVKAILMLHRGRQVASESKIAQLLASYERLQRHRRNRHTTRPKIGGTILKISIETQWDDWRRRNTLSY
jgi:hypothetical protein